MYQPKQSLPLWPGEPPASSPVDAFRPTLDLYPVPGDASRGAVLVCPGGGYAGRAPHEQAPIANLFNDAGLHAFVVQYRVAPHRHPAPLLDASRALRTIRRNAGAWQVAPDRIAVCGFSAGGHLAASLGVHFDLDVLRIGDDLDEVNPRPDALILAYPVISTEDFAHRGSFQNLLGPDPDPQLLTMMSLEQQVTNRTPPAFLWHTSDDAVVPVKNSLRFAEALREHEIPFELHVYPYGVHGLGLAEAQSNVATWTDLCVTWLRGMGW
jgi:acetyl esterase/lipase